MRELRESLNATRREKLGAIDVSMEIMLTLKLAEIERRLAERLEARLREQRRARRS